MGVIHETAPMAVIYKNPLQMFGLITGSVTALGALGKACETIPPDEVALRLRRGRPKERRNWEFDGLRGIHILEDEEIAERGRYKVYNKKFVFKIPGIDDIVRVPIMPRSTPLPLIELQSQDQKKVQVNSKAIWHVRPDRDYPYLARFNVYSGTDKNETSIDNELTEQVVSTCGTGLRESLLGRNSEDIVNLKAAEATAATQERVSSRLAEIGVALKELTISASVYADSEVHRQGLENMFSPPEQAVRRLGESALSADEFGMGRVIPFPFRDDAA
jgi:hypothetical protein